MKRALFSFIAFFGTFGAFASASHAQSSQDIRVEASGHFDRGMQAFSQGNLATALEEFRAAYEIDPTSAALYNLARVHEALGQVAEAASAFERYLLLDDPSITRARRTEVEQLLEEQLDHLGEISIVTNVPGSQVWIDGLHVGTLPRTDPFRLETGAHEIVVRANGYRDVRRDISLVPRARELLAIELQRGHSSSESNGEEDDESLGAQAAEESSGTTRRQMGTYFLISGAAVTLLSTGLFVWNEVQIDATDEDVVSTSKESEGCADPSRADECAALHRKLVDLADEQSVQDTLRIVGAVGIGLGLAASATGLGFHLWPEEGTSRDQAAVRIGPATIEATLHF